MTGHAALAIAHRCGAGDAPENTLAALRITLAQGLAGWCELDLQCSRDGVPMVVHDATLGRTSDVGQVFPARAGDPVGSFTAAELRALDAGAWFDAQRFAGERIPTFSEVLDLAVGRLGLMLELKGGEGQTGLEAALARELQRRGLVGSDAIEVWSFDIEALRRFHALAPGVRLGAFARSHAALDLPRSAAMLSGASLYPEITAAEVADIRRHGPDVVAATQDSPARIRRALGLGLQRIITDYPQVLVRVGQGVAPFDATPLVIDDVAADTDDAFMRQVLVRNVSAERVPLTGWYLRNAFLTPLAAGGWLPPQDRVAVRMRMGPRDELRRGNRPVALHAPDHRVADVIEY